MESSRTPCAHAARHPLMSMMTAVASLVSLLVLVAAPAIATPGNDNRAPDLSEAVEAVIGVDPGHKVAYHTYAAGVQIYKWNGTAWAFVAPEAYLFADAGGHGVVGIHYAGPTWESHGGSKVVGERVDGVNVDPTAIDWLLLRAKSSGGAGPFKDVTFIQRVNTVGGRAPSQPGTVIGEEVQIPYTAEYFFYRKHK